MARSAAPTTAALTCVTLSLAACSSPSEPPTAPSTTRSGDLRVEVIADGLDHPWDIGFLPGGGAVVSEREGRLRHLPTLEPGVTPVTLEADLDDVYAEGEGGLLGLAVLPTEGGRPSVAVCLDHAEDGRPVDIRVVTFEIDVDGRRATRASAPLVEGLPVADGGRHSGCRPTVGAAGELYVGTGDTADPGVPQDRSSLGGKVLRVDPATGRAWRGNPFAGATDPRERLVYTSGHRNVQGIAIQPGTGAVYAAEHGPSIDDEVTRLVAGGNAGWDPSRGGESSQYDESVPMTDTERYPDAMPSLWTSGPTTEAISGAAFLDGEQWGERDGALVVTALKGSKLIVLTLDDDGTAVAAAETPTVLEGYGRLRSPRLGPDGALYVTTDNGGDDQVLRVTPAT